MELTVEVIGGWRLLPDVGAWLGFDGESIGTHGDTIYVRTAPWYPCV